MQDFEKLGVFYLGRGYDLASKKSQDDLILYDSRDLTTHAVCIGMTGSGKTGLCLSLLEEAAIDGVPVIAIDPKGDLGNLLLTFPNLCGADFLPWVNADDAKLSGLSLDQFADRQASTWRQGLNEWGQDGERIARLKEAADFTIYTPGSAAGMPVALLKSFAPPAGTVGEDPDLMRERIASTATGVLSLLGIDADPLRSREHILIATILDSSWKGGREVSVMALIQQIQNPPFTHVGAFDLESFYPAAQRFELAMALNNLLAAPGFESWSQGSPLDVDSLLYTAEGKPRVSIFSIAHLNDSERMFFVSLLLNQVLSWMREQSGTSSLRAVLYMDEIFGYFPPVANPPSKTPLLTLLKQARAFGLGIVLATQNPVDLDYKGLANAGTWFIGRLQTERDKMRVLEGLEGASAGAGRDFDRQKMGEILASLGSRVFLMNNVHDDGPVTFQTRWALSYLRGPLARNQIKALMDERKASAAKAPAAPKAEAGAAAAPEPGRSREGAAAPGRPVLPPGIVEYFAPPKPDVSADAVRYVPAIFGAAAVHYVDAKHGADISQPLSLIAVVGNDAVPVDWQKALEVKFLLDDLASSAAEGGTFAPLPATASQVKNYEKWKKDLVTCLYANRRLDLWRSAVTGQVSRVGESERDFRIRIRQLAHERRDQDAEALRKRYAPKMAALQERIRRAEQALAREAQEVQEQDMQSAISVGATIFGAFMGRKPLGSSSLGRATTAARSAGRSVKARQDVARAEENVSSLTQQLDQLDAEFQTEMGLLSSKFDPLNEPLESVSIRPKKTNISVRLVALIWLPHVDLGAGGMLSPAWDGAC